MRRWTGYLTFSNCAEHAYVRRGDALSAFFFLFFFLVIFLDLLVRWAFPDFKAEQLNTEIRVTITAPGGTSVTIAGGSVVRGGWGSPVRWPVLSPAVAGSMLRVQLLVRVCSLAPQQNNLTRIDYQNRPYQRIEAESQKKNRRSHALSH